MNISYIAEAPPATHCGFCGASEAQAGTLISGAEAGICPNCVAQATGMLLQETHVDMSLMVQYQKVKKKVNMTFSILSILLGIAFAVIIFTTIFGKH